jgi:DNA-binding NtrC family response regulator
MVISWFRALLPLQRRTSEDATSVLAVTCSDRERSTLDEIASKSNWRLRLASSSTEAEKYLREQAIAVILFDRDLPGTHWRDHMGDLLRSAPHSCVILVSGVNDEYLWEEVIRNGGYDVLTKPLQESQVVPAVTGAWWYWKVRR